MTTIHSLRQLKHCTSPFVYVELYDKIYVNTSHGYMEKRYFTSSDIEKMYNIKPWRLSNLVVGNGGKRIRLTLAEVREIVRKIKV